MGVPLKRVHLKIYLSCTEDVGQPNKLRQQALFGIVSPVCHHGRKRKTRKFTRITEIIEEIRRGRKVKQVAKEFCVGQTQVH